MPVVKRLNDDFVIDNKIKANANITLSTNTVYIQGNLVVGGNATAITKTDLNITDNIITVNAGETGPGVTLGTAGLNVDRGSLANVALLWSEPIGKWVLTDDGTTYETIQTGSATSVTSPQVYALVL
jgi:hypothetical protein